MAGAASLEPEDHRFQDSHGLVADHPGAGDAAQMRALAADREDEARRKAGIGRGGEPVVVADPVDDPRGQHLTLPAERRPAPFALAPVVDQLDGEDGRGGIAAVAQVPQPGKAVQGIQPQHAGARPAPRRVVAPGHHGADLAVGHQLAGDQAHADHGIAGPRIRRHGKKGARAAPTQGQRIEPGAQQPAAERQPLGWNRLGRRGTDRAGPGDHRLTGSSCISDQGHCSSGFFGPALSAEFLRGCQV
jgi:hypothetical protein